MSKAKTKEYEALVKKIGEMFDEAGCMPDIDGEEVLAETLVPEAKEYIAETIDDPEAQPRYGIDPGLRWSFHGWRKNRSKNAKNLHLASVRPLSNI